jgi:hypothetical protein
MEIPVSIALKDFLLQKDGTQQQVLDLLFGKDFSNI